MKDYGKLLDEAENAWDDYKAGRIKSWDVDGVIVRLKPLIAKKSADLDEKRNYLLTRLETPEHVEGMKAWRERTSGWMHERMLQESLDYYSLKRQRQRGTL